MRDKIFTLVHALCECEGPRFCDGVPAGFWWLFAILSQGTVCKAVIHSDEISVTMIRK